MMSHILRLILIKIFFSLINGLMINFMEPVCQTAHDRDQKTQKEVKREKNPVLKILTE